MGQKSDRISAERQDAWIGDAVLALFAREWILEKGHEFPESPTQLFTHMTSNQFLGAIGRPTAVEAHIGRLYQQKGHEAARTYIQTELVPLFLKQAHNRKLHAR